MEAVRAEQSQDVLPVDAGGGTVVTIDGMPGFEKCRRFVIVTASNVAPFSCLQGLDDPKPSFLALDPRTVIDEYAVPITAAERARLGATDGDALLWLALACFDANLIKLNLRAPVVVNPRTMTGVQILAAESPYSTEYAIPLD